ncbi:uncharacterized protein LOC124259097 [Haliotis rubra]|uniref:uncharacterized protein LOC124259097 n=1 Tax=Haliotis rubra TaxID=36100 RepID=UPI001EE60E96|nr:uncharacterized protein LOC124259097 [Haliotis rubra]
MTASMVFCLGFILVCQVAVYGSAKVSKSTVFGSSSNAVVLSRDNTLAPSPFLTDTPSSVSASPTVTTPYPVTSSFHSYFILREDKMKTSSIKHSSTVLTLPVPSIKHYTRTIGKPKFLFGGLLSSQSSPGWIQGSINPTGETAIQSSRLPTPWSSVTLSTANKTPTLPIQPGHRLIRRTSKGVHPLVVPTLTSIVTPTPTPTLSLPQVETSAATTKHVSRKLNTNGMFLEKLVQNTRPETTESPPLSGEYIAIIILSILCGIVLMMIIIYIICTHRCCRVRFQVVTIRCGEELSSSEVSLEDGLPDGHTNMTNSASLSLDETGQTSFIGTDVQNSSLENSQLEETAQDPSNQDMRQNNVTELRHVIKSEYMDLSYFTSNSDKEETDTLNKAGRGGPGCGDAPAVKDDKSTPVENHSSNSISTNETRVVYTNEKPATGTLKRPKLLYDKYGYTLVIKTGDDKFRIAEESDHTNPLKDSTSYPHNHGVVSKVVHNATVNSPVSKHKSKPFNEHVLLPKTKLVERLVGSSQSDLHSEEANHTEDPLVSPKIETHAFNHYLDLYSQIDDDSCGKNGEMDLVENLSTETEEKQSGETHLQNTGTDIEQASGCAVSNTTTTSSNVLLESLDILQGLQETTPSTDANSDYHSSGEDTSPEEDIDIMAYLVDYVPPEKTYLGIIYEYEEDVEFDEPDNDQSSECDDSEMEESAKEQVNKEHANSLKQELDRMKTDEAMPRVTATKQEGIEDEDTVGNLEILHTHQMNGEHQADTEGVQKQVQGEAETDSVDKQSADEDATGNCSERVDYQGLIHTAEGDDLVVDGNDHTYPHDLQGKVMYTQDTGNEDVQRPDVVKSGSDTGEDPLVVKQGEAQEIAQDVAQKVPQAIAQDVSQEVAQEVTQDVAQEVPQAIAQDVSQEVAQEVTQDVAQEVPQAIAQDVSQEVAQEVTQDVAQEVPQAIAQDVSQEVAQEVPQAIAQDVSQEVAQEVTQDVAQGVPQAIAQDVSQEVAQEVTQEIVEDVAQQVVEDVAQQVVEDVAQQVVEDVAQQVVEDVAQQVVEDVAQQVVEDVAQQVVEDVAQQVVEGVAQEKSSEKLKEQKTELEKGEENSDEQVKTDGEFDEHPDSIKDTIIEEARTDIPRNEQVLEGQDELTETGTDQQIQEDFVRAEDQLKGDEAEAGIEMDGDEQEKYVDEAQKEKSFEEKPYDTAVTESQIMDIAKSTQIEPHKDHYDDGNAEVQQSSDGVAIQEEIESVIHLEAKNEMVGENLQQEGKMKENEDKEHEETENNNDFCDGSRDILFLDTEEEEEDEDDDDGWMDLDEPISMVLAACQLSSNDDSDIDEMGCEDSRPFGSNSQDEGAQVLDNCFARDYIERLQFLQPTKGILCKERETGAINGGKRVSKKVRFILPDEWDTC